MDRICTLVWGKHFIYHYYVLGWQNFLSEFVVYEINISRYIINRDNGRRKAFSISTCWKKKLIHNRIPKTIYTACQLVFWGIFQLFLATSTLSFDWLVGRSVSQSVGRSVGWLVGRLVGRSVGWSVGWSVGRSVSQLVGWLVGWSLAILGQEDRSLPMLKVDKENWVALRLCLAVWGVWWGPPGSQIADIHPHGKDEVGWEKDGCHWRF